MQSANPNYPCHTVRKTMQAQTDTFGHSRFHSNEGGIRSDTHNEMTLMDVINDAVKSSVLRFGTKLKLPATSSWSRKLRHRGLGMLSRILVAGTAMLLATIGAGQTTKVVLLG